MPKKRNNNFYTDSDDNDNRRLNLAQGMAEKIGVKTNVDREFSIVVPKGGFEQRPAPTSKPQRPRARAIAYDYDSRTLYIVFRDGTWWEYRDVGAQTFVDLSTADSTSEFLPRLENVCSGHGPANLSNITEERQERLSYAAESSARLQQILILEDGDIFRRGDLKFNPERDDKV